MVAVSSCTSPRRLLKSSAIFQFRTSFPSQLIDFTLFHLSTFRNPLISLFFTFKFQNLQTTCGADFSLPVQEICKKHTRRLKSAPHSHQADPRFESHPFSGAFVDTPVPPPYVGGFMFELVSPYAPAGDQPQAIKQLTEGILNGAPHQVLLGVTGSGKTFSVANVIANVNKPTLVISHNKTLAAQLYAEFKSFFPNNAVEYFVSYFDYYQPEAYIPRTDTFIEKDSSINEEIERLRLSTMSSLFSRRDVIVVASVSCIYGIGSKEDYSAMIVPIRVGLEMTRDQLLHKLIDMQYERNDIAFNRGQFRVRGDTVELWTASTEDALRIEFFGDQIDRLTRFDTLTGDTLATVESTTIYPGKQFTTPADKLKRATLSIRAELTDRIAQFEKEGKLLEAQRIKMRTEYDLEMMLEMGFCSGIENYTRHLSGRPPGSRPNTLFDFFRRISCW
jgi:excinuclease ABC subunit B